MVCYNLAAVLRRHSGAIYLPGAALIGRKTGVKGCVAAYEQPFFTTGNFLFTGLYDRYSSDPNVQPATGSGA